MAKKEVEKMYLDFVADMDRCPLSSYDKDRNVLIYTQDAKLYKRLRSQGYKGAKGSQHEGTEQDDKFFAANKQILAKQTAMTYDNAILMTVPTKNGGECKTVIFADNFAELQCAFISVSDRCVYPRPMVNSTATTLDWSAVVEGKKIDTNRINVLQEGNAAVNVINNIVIDTVDRAYKESVANNSDIDFERTFD